MSTTVEPWALCPVCRDKGKYVRPDWGLGVEGPIEPCPACAAHNAAVEREVAAAVGAANSSHALEGHAMMEDRDNALIERDAALAEVARLTAHGKELRDALAGIEYMNTNDEMGDWDCCPECNYWNPNPDGDSFQSSRRKKSQSIGHAPDCKIGKALSTPAGSDEPLRRVRAAAYREGVDDARNRPHTWRDDLCSEYAYRLVKPAERGEGGIDAGK